MTEKQATEDDDLTVDGIDLLAALRERTPTPVGEATITDRPPLGGRWVPALEIPTIEPVAGMPGGLSKLQVGVVVGTFALGAVLGLMVGLGRNGTVVDTPVGSPPIAAESGE